MSNSESNNGTTLAAEGRLFHDLLQAFMSKDLPKIMSYFADDAILYDPHYPQPRMVGKAAIQQGIEWSMSSLEKPGFKVRQLWLDGHSGVAELDTHHIIKGGMEAKFDQVFVFEVRGDKFARVQSYVPYPPHGIAGIIGNVTKLAWRLQGKMK